MDVYTAATGGAEDIELYQALSGGWGDPAASFGAAYGYDDAYANYDYYGGYYDGDYYNYYPGDDYYYEYEYYADDGVQWRRALASAFCPVGHYQASVVC